MENFTNFVRDKLHLVKDFSFMKIVSPADFNGPKFDQNMVLKKIEFVGFKIMKTNFFI